MLTPGADVGVDAARAVGVHHDDRPVAVADVPVERLAAGAVRGVAQMSWLAGAAGRPSPPCSAYSHVERVCVDVGDLGAGGAGEVAVDVGGARDAGEHRAAVTGLHRRRSLP